MRSTEKIRNVVLVGHNTSGKTSLAEALLAGAGVIGRQGTIEKGSTVMDHDPEERSRQQSISLTVASFDWNDHHINLIDTPGYADFRGEALLGLTAADLAVFVIDGVAGVQPQDVVLWRHAAALGIPRLVFVNKLDRERSSFDRTLAEVREVFGSHADPTELPIGAESSFHGVADLLTHHAFVYDTGHAEPTEVPTELADVERREHEHLVEDVIELDDELLEQYLSGTEPSHGATRTSAPRCGRPCPRVPGALRIGHRGDRRRSARRLHLPSRPGAGRPRTRSGAGGRRHRRHRAGSRWTAPRPRVQDHDRRVPGSDLHPEGAVRHDPHRRRARELTLGWQGTAPPPDLVDRKLAGARRSRRCRRHRGGDETHRHPHR